MNKSLLFILCFKLFLSSNIFCAAATPKKPFGSSKSAFKQIVPAALSMHQAHLALSAHTEHPQVRRVEVLKPAAPKTDLRFTCPITGDRNTTGDITTLIGPTKRVLSKEQLDEIFG